MLENKNEEKGKKYKVNVRVDEDGSKVTYTANIYNQMIDTSRKVSFRYSQLKNFHDYILQNFQEVEATMPKLPETQSFLFFLDKTNSDKDKIEKRRGEIEIYVQTIINSKETLMQHYQIAQKLASGKYFQNASHQPDILRTIDHKFGEIVESIKGIMD